MPNHFALAMFSLAALCCSGNPVIILDDRDGQSITATNAHEGTYAPCLKDAYKGQFTHDWATNKGRSSATFSFDPPKDGCWMVEEYHPGGEEACSRYLPQATQLEIGYCNNMTDFATIDQSRNGGKWNVVGQWKFYKGKKGYFKLANSEKDSCSEDQCFWVADAFRVTWVSDFCETKTPFQVLLDDAGEHVRPGTAWTKAEGMCSRAGQVGGFHHNNGVHDGEDFAEWNFTVSKDGCYWVEEYHPDTRGLCGFELASQVPVQIHFCKGLHTAGIVDQSQRASQWNKLMRLPFYTSHSAAIQISAKGLDINPRGIWAADAFRLTWDADNCKDEVAETKTQQEAKVSVLPALVDDREAMVKGVTLQPLSQCPATASRTFLHDGLQKSQQAEAKYLFYPPHDGCYLVEERHPQLEQCKASANTKVHIGYCRELEAIGTLNQSASAGEWSFLAALPFYTGHVGSVTLSNEGTEAGTLTVFDQVRFTWSAKTCSDEFHPRAAEIRMPIDFKHVSKRQTEFGKALKTKLAALGNVPEKALRLTGLRSGSIIASFLVMPSVDDPLAPAGLKTWQTMEKLRRAVSEHAADLCDLTGAPPEDFETYEEACKIEFTDLGLVSPSVKPVQRPQQEEQKVEAEPEKGFDFMILAYCAAAVALLFKISVCLYMVKSRRAKGISEPSADAAFSMEEGKATDAEEGKAIDEKKPAEDEIDNSSTVSPSSDAPSEPSINGDVENASNASTPALAVVKALSDQNI